MDVFTKYFRRLLTQNAAHVFSGGGRAADTGGSYQQLVTEVQKLRKDPEQAGKIAESIDTNEADLFRDFDLPTFMSHFQLDPIAKTALALACRSASKTVCGLKVRLIFITPVMQVLTRVADAILANTSEDFLMAIAHPIPAQSDDLHLGFAVPSSSDSLVILHRIGMRRRRLQLSYAIHMRYQSLQLPLPAKSKQRSS